MANYEVNNRSIRTLLSWIEEGIIAIPEIQRPFVWSGSKVRDLIDSLYKDFPIGYLIVWQNPDVNLKDGTKSIGKKVIIDGQQRLTALSAALSGQEVFNDRYEKKRIIISFNPKEEKFDVANPAIRKSDAWVYDISEVFKADFDSFSFIIDYKEKNPEVDTYKINSVIQRLIGINNNLVGIIELSHEMDIEDVTEIFIRINSKGVELNQADFVMSKIASNEIYGGNETRKLIDYFCHLMNNPEDYEVIRKNDPGFTNKDLFKKISWLKNYNEDIYILSYTDVLRVAFTYKFNRARLSELVNLLSGRDFETKEFYDEIAEKSFTLLREGVLEIVNETNFKRYIMILKSAGIIDKDLVRSKNILNFGYILYLTLKGKSENSAIIENIIRRWIIMSMLTGRYSGSPESAFDYDIKRLNSKKPLDVLENIEEGELSDAFLNNILITELEASIRTNPQYNVYLIAQIKNNTKGFLSQAITIKDMIENRGDTHHIFPKKYLQKNGYNNRRDYNQVSNYVYTQSEINIAIKDKSPKEYFNKIIKQCDKGSKLFYGGITSLEELYDNLRANDIPLNVMEMESEDYPKFLEERRRLMALRIKKYYYSLI
jgi:hypothetical protein